MKTHIGSHNIKEYITYLYYARNKKQVPDEILESWITLSDAIIQEHLTQLYHNWNLNTFEIKAYEDAFLRLTQPENVTLNISTQNNVNKQTNISSAPRNAKEQVVSHPTPTQKNSTTSKTIWKYLLAAVCIGFGSMWLIQKLNQEPPIHTESINNTVAIKENTKDNQPAVAVREITEKEKIHAKKIEQFIKSENDRDLGSIMSLLSPNIEQFKSIAYPRQEEIENFYVELWNAYSRSNNSRPEVKRIAENIYSIKTRYSLQVSDSTKPSIQTSEQKITFNNQNEIIKVERLK